MRSEKSAESHVVCLVDDDPLVLTSLGNLLTSDGIAARCFDKAETFLAHIQVHREELVVLDIRMVGMLGSASTPLLDLLSDACDNHNRQRTS